MHVSLDLALSAHLSSGMSECSTGSPSDQPDHCPCISLSRSLKLESAPLARQAADLLTACVTCPCDWVLYLGCRCSPNEPVSVGKLHELGVLYWRLDADKYEDDPRLNAIRKVRNYSFIVSMVHSSMS